LPSTHSIGSISRITVLFLNTCRSGIQFTILCGSERKRPVDPLNGHPGR
jgi:hypothetical protein